MEFRMDVSSIKQILEDHVGAAAQLFRGSDNHVYARFSSEWGVETVSVEAQRFADWLTDHCINTNVRPDRLAIKSVVGSLKAKQSACSSRPVHVRVGADQKGEVYLDLADRTGKVVRVSKEGWVVTEETPILFPTQANQRTIVGPTKDGSVRLLGERFALSSHNEALIISFCLACLRGRGPYPILVIVGPEHSGKTTLANYIRTLLDPSSIPLRNFPKNADELGATAADSHVLAYDDVQTIPPWLEMAFCKLSKGVTFSERRGGAEHVRSQGAKALILSGSDEMLMHRELVSRSLVVRLGARTKFSSSTEQYGDHSELLGALLNIVSHGLNRWDGQNISKPLREFEFENWMAACELPRWGLKDFNLAYEANVADSMDDLLELDPFLLALRGHVIKTKVFRGTCAALLNTLNELGSGPRGYRWPKTPRAVSSRLRRDGKLMPGIKVVTDIKEGRNRDRIVVVELTDPPAYVSPRGEENREEHSKASRKGSSTDAKAPAMPLFAASR